jgi:hypothetical protein
MNEPTPYTPDQPPAQKHRHGCLTAYLVFVIIANAGATLFYMIGSGSARSNVASAPPWAFPVLIVLGVSNLIFAIALLRWEKWGFWGFVASSVGAFLVNTSIGIGTAAALLGLLGVAVLYGVLHIGAERKGWSQLD